MDKEMDKKETIFRVDMIRFRLRNAASELLFVGRHSDYVYQAKFENYEKVITKIMGDLLKDEYNEPMLKGQ